MFHFRSLKYTFIKRRKSKREKIFFVTVIQWILSPKICWNLIFLNIEINVQSDGIKWHVYITHLSAIFAMTSMAIMCHLNSKNAQCYVLITTISQPVNQHNTLNLIESLLFILFYKKIHKMREKYQRKRSTLTINNKN